ncbi:ferredoxin [Chlamydia serpentis]|nr:ferredoxin [Chlamydia serpentis]
MDYKSQLAFSCPCCHKGNVCFSVFNLDTTLTCSVCASTYAFDSVMRNDIRQFVALCKRIHDANSILGSATVSVSVEDNQMDIPFQLLFSRFPVVLNLSLEGRKIIIRFLFDALNKTILHQESDLVS